MEPQINPFPKWPLTMGKNETNWNMREKLSEDIGKPWENIGKQCKHSGKPWENPGKISETMGKNRRIGKTQGEEPPF